DQAEAAFRRAHELQPENLLALAGIASVADRRGEHAQARVLAEQVLAAQPGYPDALMVLARADLADRNFDAAEAHVRTMTADPRPPPPILKLAQGRGERIAAERERKFD